MIALPGHIIHTPRMTNPDHPDERYMLMALTLAREAADAGEVPVGAVIVKDRQILGKAYNQTETLRDPTAHAEILAITQAADAVNDWRLNDCVMYVTKEPCVMCAGALVLARIDTVIWGLTDPQRGGAVSRFQVLQEPALNHRVNVISGFMEEDAKEIMQGFFQARRRED